MRGLNMAHVRLVEFRRGQKMIENRVGVRFDVFFVSFFVVIARGDWLFSNGYPGDIRIGIGQGGRR